MDHLLNAVMKCYYQYGRKWAGYLIPKEILALRDIGVKCDSHYIDIAIDWKRRGWNNGRWFYFEANKKFEDMKGGK
jgi:hypothetical protein